MNWLLHCSKTKPNYMTTWKFAKIVKEKTASIPQVHVAALSEWMYLFVGPSGMTQYRGTITSKPENKYVP